MRACFAYRGCAGRRAYGGHFAERARGFGHGAGLGGRGFFGGRKLASGELQLVILALLDEQPRYGYEIIKALEETSRGFYSPSPGMVYPALTYLEEVGYATVETEGSKKLYRITEAGRAKLAEHRVFVDTVLAQLARAGATMDRMRQVFANDDANAEIDVDHAAVDKARRGLRAALVAKLNASPSPDELQRVAKVLQDAADALRKK